MCRRGGVGFLMMLLLAGCSATALSPAEEAISRWEGRPADEVVASWGEPEVIVDKPAGRIYIYEATHYGRRYYPANLGQAHVQSNAGVEGLACRGVLEVDREGVVKRARWVGEECWRR